MSSRNARPSIRLALCLAWLVCACGAAHARVHAEALNKLSEGTPAAEAYKAGLRLFNAHEYDKARVKLLEAVRLDPNSLEARRLLGDCYARLNDHPAALAAYEEAVRLKPDDADAQFGMGMAHLLMSQYDRALGPFQNVARLEPKKARGFFQLGYTLVQMKRPNDAISALSRAIAIEPKHVQAHAGLALTYQALGRNDDVMREYQTLRSLDAKLAGQLLDQLNQSPRATGASPRPRRPTATAGQQPSRAPARSSCPAVKVSGPHDVPDGQPMTFTVDLSGGDETATPTFNWTVSAGIISSGQGTSTITVDTTGDGGRSVVATVNVGGYAPECDTSASRSAAVLNATPPIKFGEYTAADLSVNPGVLDEWTLRLKQDPMDQGYVIAYGGRTSGPDDAQRAGNDARNYAIEVHGVSPDRLFVVVGGYREKPTIELWLRPRDGAEPALTPTVDPKDVTPATRRPR